MIFFFNGAQKNGSHFNLLTVTESMAQQGIQFEIVGGLYFNLDKVFDNEVKQSKQLLDSIMDRPPSTIYVCKGHWASPAERNLLLSYRDMRIFLIWRDLRDVLVSNYYFQTKRFNGPYRDFSDFYWRRGRSELFQQMIYRKVWLPVSDDRVCHVNFSDLKQKFRETAAKMLAFAGIINVDLADLEKRVSLPQLKTKHNDAQGLIFRRGAVGEHHQVIKSEAIYEDIARIERLNLPALKVQAFRHNPKVVLQRYYAFPGRKLLLSTSKMYRKIRPKSQQTEKSTVAFWET